MNTENKLYMFDVIDIKSNVSIGVANGHTLGFTIFSAAAYIFDKYSQHSEYLPSFDGLQLEVRHNFIHADYNGTKLKIVPHENSHEVDFTRITVKIINDIVCTYTFDGVTTTCEIVHVYVPYDLIEKSQFYNIANTKITDYRGLHDLIMGYNLCTPNIYSASTTCVEEDMIEDKVNGTVVKIAPRLIGEKIAYSKAMIKKMTHDISAHKAFAEMFYNEYTKYMRKFFKHFKIANKVRCSKKELETSLKVLTNTAEFSSDN